MTLLRHRILFISAVAASAAFAFWPMTPAAIMTPTIDQSPAAPKQVAALDLAAFRTPIWIAEPRPPAPTPPAAAPPPPPPLKLQLLAIIAESNGGAYKAALYDPDTDRILVVAAGERVGTRTVEQVDKTTLTLRDGDGPRVLALKESGPP